MSKIQEMEKSSGLRKAVHEFTITSDTSSHSTKAMTVASRQSRADLADDPDEQLVDVDQLKKPWSRLTHSLLPVRNRWISPRKSSW